MRSATAAGRAPTPFPRPAQARSVPFSAPHFAATPPSATIAGSAGGGHQLVEQIQTRRIACLRTTSDAAPALPAPDEAEAAPPCHHTHHPSHQAERQRPLLIGPRRSAPMSNAYGSAENSGRCRTGCDKRPARSVFPAGLVYHGAVSR
ncbi:MAG TPA: hypothetical protein VFS21_27505 [Roseiflexaceae bacterium]|nr:hypothetical protein [Roseiflexaceae bacterium]